VVATVVVAFHIALLLGTSVSIAATVNEFDGAVGPRAGMMTDERMPALREFEPGQSAVDAGQSRLNTFDPDSDAGVLFYIQGIAFTVDGTVARSFRTELANDAMPEGQDQPAIGDGNFSLTEYNVKRAGANFYEHMRSVSEGRFSQPQLLQVNEWDARDFKPPQWVDEARDVVRSDDASSPEAVSVTSHRGGVDTETWIKAGMNFVFFVQNQFRRMDPLFIAILALVSVPFALIGIARSTRRGRAPSRALRHKHDAEIPPVRHSRVRGRRKRIALRNVTAEIRD
jgi:hypothetical protein